MTNADTTKKARRDAAREHAREAREAAAKKRKRNKLFAQGGVLLGVLALAGVVVLVVSNLNAPAAPGPLNMASDGIVLNGDGMTMGYVATDAIAADGDPVASTAPAAGDPVAIVMYVDYQCPYCADFETTNATQISQWVTAGMATVEIHPIANLDSQSLGTRYSSRSANAAACVANFEPEQFWAVNTAFYANQPEEQTSGLDTAAITTLVSDAGASSQEVADCIGSETFKSWVTDATLRTRSAIPNSDLASVEGTPTVLVNGQQYAGELTDADAFTAFVSAVAAADSGETETPTE